MKKIYINPELEIVKIQTMQMMAASLVVNDDPLNVVDDVDDLLAPGTGFDFDDESFDFGGDESVSNFE